MHDFRIGTMYISKGVNKLTFIKFSEESNPRKKMVYFLQDPPLGDGLRTDVPHLNKIVLLARGHRNSEDIVVFGERVCELLSDGCE